MKTKSFLLTSLLFVSACFAQEASPSKTVNEQLSELAQQFSTSMPPETLHIFDQGVEDVRIAGIANHALKVGDEAAAFELPNARGEIVKLQELLSHGPVVLVWYRGGWCPYCNVHLNALQKALPEIQAEGATLVAISPQLPDHTLSTVEKNALTFEVLSDVDNKTARRYGIVFSVSPAVAEEMKKHINLAEINGNDRYEMPLAAAYVIDQAGIIRYAFADPDYKKRAEPADIVNALKAIKQQVGSL